MKWKAGRIAEIVGDYQWHITEGSWSNIHELVVLVYHNGADWKMVKRKAKEESKLEMVPPSSFQPTKYCSRGTTMGSPKDECPADSYFYLLFRNEIPMSRT